MSGVKGKSGRRKLPETIIKETLENAGKDFPKLWAINKELAMSGDKDALKVYFSYVLGLPTQKIDARVKAIAGWTPEEYMKLERDLIELKAAEVKLLSEPTELDNPNVET